MSNTAFIDASRKQLRFATPRQQGLSTEDLWNLNLVSLDAIGQIVIAALKPAGTSLLENPNKKESEAQKDNELRLEIIKTIIAVKQDENKLAVASAANKRRKEILEELVAKKQIGALEGKSIEELQAEIAALG